MELRKVQCYGGPGGGGSNRITSFSLNWRNFATSKKFSPPEEDQASHGAENFGYPGGMEGGTYRGRPMFTLRRAARDTLTGRMAVLSGKTSVQFKGSEGGAPGTVRGGKAVP